MGRRKIDATDYIEDAQTRATAIKKRKIGVIRKAQGTRVGNKHSLESKKEIHILFLSHSTEYAAMTGCGVAVVFLPDEQGEFFF